MSDYDKSMCVHLICNQSVLNYNILQVMNTMALSYPWADSLDIIALHLVKNCEG